MRPLRRTLVLQNGYGLWVSGAGQFNFFAHAAAARNLHHIAAAVQECDARMPNSSTLAWFINMAVKKIILKKIIGKIMRTIFLFPQL